MPDTVSQTIPEPTIQFHKFFLNIGQAEIINPASLYRFDFLHPLIEGHRCGFSGFFLAAFASGFIQCLIQ